MIFSSEFCCNPFKRCSVPPNKRIIPKKVNLGLIQAATSTFVLIMLKKPFSKLGHNQNKCACSSLNKPKIHLSGYDSFVWW